MIAETSQVMAEVAQVAQMAADIPPLHADAPQWVLVWLGIGGFIITIMATTAAVVWQAGNIRTDMVSLLAKNKALIDDDIRAIRSEMANRAEAFSLERVRELDSVRKETGDMGGALRTKIHDVELFVRDEFIRKETFNMVIDRLTDRIGAVDANQNERSSRIESKVDGLIARMSSVDDLINTIKQLIPKRS